MEQAPTSVVALLQVRMKQFKVQAEKADRELEAKRHRPAGTGGWDVPSPGPVSPQASLF